MAAATLLGAITFTTTAGSKTVVATPAVGDLLMICAAWSSTGTAVDILPTDNNADGLGVWSTIRFTTKNAAADGVAMYVRNRFIGSATSTTFTHNQAGSNGGGLAVIKITGMGGAGLRIVRQWGEDSGLGASTPAPVFPDAPLTTSVIIGMVANFTSPAGLTPRSSPAYTELADAGYTVPTDGIEIMSINSGETSATITWGSTSASIHRTLVAEFDTKVPPLERMAYSVNQAPTRASYW